MIDTKSPSLPSPAGPWPPWWSSVGSEACPSWSTQTAHPHHHLGTVTGQSASHKPALRMTTSPLRMCISALVRSEQGDIYMHSWWFKPCLVKSQSSIFGVHSQKWPGFLKLFRKHFNTSLSPPILALHLLSNPIPGHRHDLHSFFGIYGE